MNILIAGLTASGKNLLSMRVAEILKKKFQLEAEIINADSVQIYCDLKIIANHPTKSDFSALPHHLYAARKFVRVVLGRKSKKNYLRIE